MSDGKTTCDCKLCRRTREEDTILQSGSREEVVGLAERMREKLFYTEDDLSWCRAVLDGSWPQAIEILESSLERAKKLKSERDLIGT